MTRRRGGGLVAAVAVLAGIAGPGGAPGAAAAEAPSYQPDSPAGTEYAIPLDEARKTGSASSGSGSGGRSSAAPTSGSPSGGDDEAALFGEGIAPAKRSAGVAGTSRKSAKTTTKAVPVAPSEVGAPRPAASGISGTAVAVGTGGLVLALGAALAGAIVMSRRVPRSR